MSLDAYTKVWSLSRQKGTKLLVLLALADYAKDDGTGAYGTNERMARKARLGSVRALQLAYEALQASGELLIEYGAGPPFKGQKTNLYHIVYQDGRNAGQIDQVRQRMKKPRKGVKKSSSPRQGVNADSSQGVNADSSPPTIRMKRDRKPSASSSAKASDSAAREGKSSARQAGGQRKLFRGAPSEARRGADVGDLRGQKQATREKLSLDLLRAMFQLCYLTSGVRGEPPVSDRQAGQVAAVVRTLRDNSVTMTPWAVEQFTIWWAGNYRSKVQGQPDVYKPPLPRQVQELWAEAMQARVSARTVHAGAPPKDDGEARKRVDEAMAAHAARMREGQR